MNGGGGHVCTMQFSLTASLLRVPLLPCPGIMPHLHFLAMLLLNPTSACGAEHQATSCAFWSVLALVTAHLRMHYSHMVIASSPSSPNGEHRPV